MIKTVRLSLKTVFLILSVTFLLCLFSISLVVKAEPSKAQVAADKIDYFEMSLEELLNIKVSVSAGTESRQNFVPSSVTIISQSDIELANGRSLSDLLNIYVPGYFKAEDKDDTIASFRGLAPDNNSKVLLLIDGVRINADWFWGPADSVLNGIGLDYIERIEVIRGPGSVTLGQGAQMGVINVITKLVEESEVNIAAGEAGWQSVSGMTGLKHNGLSYQFIGSAQALDGFSLPHNGWANEVMEGDSSHPSVAADRGTKLNNAESIRMLARVSDFDWTLWFQHHQQKRDLYNWTKDRDQVEQRLSIIAGDIYYPLNNELTVKLLANFQNDDYALYDRYSGQTTAGANEQRSFAQARLYTRENNQGISWLLAAELEHIKTGSKNWQGDNFIVNKTSDLSVNVNKTNTWLFPSSYTNKAILGELNAIWSSSWQANLSFRNDYNHNWGEQFTPRMSLTYQHDPSSNVYRLTYQRGFNGPPGVHYTGGFLGDGLLSENNLMYLESSGMTSSTTGLAVTNAESPRAETIRSFEFSVKGVVDKYLSYEVTAFSNEINNYILTLSTRNGTPGAAIGSDFVGNWGGVFYYANQPGALKIRGLEALANWKRNNWRHQISYSTHDVVSADGFELGMKSPVAGSESDLKANGLPEGIFRYQGFWRASDEVSLSYQHVILNSWWAPWTNSKESGLDWGNLSAKWAYNKNLNFVFAINNVWDEDKLYPIRARGKGNETPGTPSLEPRNMTFSMRYKF